MKLVTFVCLQLFFLVVVFSAFMRVATSGVLPFGTIAGYTSYTEVFTIPGKASEFTVASTLDGKFYLSPCIGADGQADTSKASDTKALIVLESQSGTYPTGSIGANQGPSTPICAKVVTGSEPTSGDVVITAIY